MKQAQRIARNIILLLSSELIGFVISAFITIFIARYLGTTGFGYYSFVLAFAGIFQLIAESGLSNIMIREIAVHKENLPSLIGITKSLIWILSIIVFLIIVATINVIHVEETTRKATYIMGAAVLATVHAMGYNAIFRAMEELEYSATGFLLHKILLFSLITVVIRLKLGLVQIVLAYLISNTFLWFFYYMIVRYRYAKPKMIVDIKTWKYFISEAVPIGISGVIRKILWHVDILILTALATKESVGLFSAPYKMIQSLNMLANTLAIPLFPLYSRLAKGSYKELFLAYEKTLKFVYLVIIPVAVILGTLSHGIIAIVFGNKFAGSSAALRILSLTLLFSFPAAQFLYLFSALGKQRLFTICSVITLAVNVTLDLILIPRYDYIGACIGTLSAEISLFTACVLFVKTLHRDISFIRASWKPFISGILMWFLLYQFEHSSLYWMLTGTFLSLLIYMVSNTILKTLSRNEFKTIKESIWFKRKLPADATKQDAK